MSFHAQGLRMVPKIYQISSKFLSNAFESCQPHFPPHPVCVFRVSLVGLSLSHEEHQDLALPSRVLVLPSLTVFACIQIEPLLLIPLCQSHLDSFPQLEEWLLPSMPHSFNSDIYISHNEGRKTHVGLETCGLVWLDC